MSTIILLGLGPHPLEPSAPVSGPGIRLRQFLDPLAAAGFEVRVAILEPRAGRRAAVPGAASAAVLDPDGLNDPKALWKALGKPRPTAVFGVGSLMPAAAAARLARWLEVPCWVDLFGDPLAEWHGNATAPGAEVNRQLKDQVWMLQREALAGGDAFSVVSGPQADALLGQVLLLGRGDGFDDPHRRVHVIPVGVPDAWAEVPAHPPFPDVLAERGLSPGDPCVFVGGSWTSWMDVESMGAALRLLVDRRPGVRIVLRGGGAEPVQVAARDRFLAAAPSGEGLVVLDPAEAGEDALLAHASGALLLDRDIPESRLGARNRLLPFARWGLRPVTTALSETARDLAALGLATAVAPGNPEAAAAALEAGLSLSAAERASLRERAAGRLRNLAFSPLLADAVGWAAAPTRWPPMPPGTLQGRWTEFPPGDLYRRP